MKRRAEAATARLKFHGAAPWARNGSGQAALDAAAAGGHARIIRLLVEGPNAGFNDGSAGAAAGASAEASAGAGAGTRGFFPGACVVPASARSATNGRTALHWAAEAGRSACVEALLGYWASTVALAAHQREEHRGRGAPRSDSPAAGWWLEGREHGSPWSADGSGRSPAALARENGHDALADLMDAFVAATRRKHGAAAAAAGDGGSGGAGEESFMRRSAGGEGEVPDEELLDSAWGEDREYAYEWPSEGEES